MIWVREVNSALLNHIKTLMDNLVDYHGNPVKPKVIMRRPNTDITTEQYPVVTVSSLQYGEDILHSDVNSRDMQREGNVCVKVRDISPTYRFKYQIDFWTENPLHLDSMTLAWATEHHRKHSTLTVVDSLGKEEQVCRFTQNSVRSMDFVDSRGKNIYRNVLIYDILVTVDLSKQTEYKVATDLSITLKEMNKGGQ
ncbi:MAG: hypothetical protein IJH34_03190 [Romboutsia sp.]|nr:hypothetical protein [Romboutsia sp.]